MGNDLVMVVELVEEGSLYDFLDSGRVVCVLFIVFILLLLFFVFFIIFYLI